MRASLSMQILALGAALTCCGVVTDSAAATVGSCAVIAESNGTGYVPPSTIPGSLPSNLVPRPGPEALYWPLASSPQLENTGVWRAKPILISGASAYRGGEFLYQDYIYDDDVTGYPAAADYVQNAADFVELRVRLLDNATAFRITYNSLLDPAIPGTTIGLGNSATAVAMPFGANAKMPAQIFVTVHGCSGVATDAATGAVLPGEIAVATDLERRQVELRVPFSVFDPRGQGALRLGAATGVWDVPSNAYLPRSGTAAAFHNVAFRFNESGAYNLSQQASALSSGDLSTLFATVDFNKLANKVDDEMLGTPDGVPVTGYMARIKVSHIELQQGRAAAPGYCIQPCQTLHDYPGRLQPYTIYIPIKAPPAAGYGMTLNLHFCGGDYTSLRNTQYGERDTGSIMVMPEARGRCSWYWSDSGTDVFEDWADAAAHYKLDPDFSAIAGISMGGYGTYKLTASYPDLFAKAAPIVGCTSADTNWTGGPNSGAPASGAGATIQPLAAAFRNVPLFSWNVSADQYCSDAAQTNLLQQIDGFGYRYIWRISDAEHGTGSGGTENFQTMADWMGSTRVDRNPPHVSYVYNAAMHEPKYGLSTGHVYWLSGIELQDPTKIFGSIDVRSHGFGVGDAPAVGGTPSAGTAGGLPVPYSETSKSWGAAPSESVENKLDITASNLKSLTIDVDRARVGCNASLNITTDAPLTVTLIGAACHPIPTSIGVAAGVSQTVDQGRFGGAFGLWLLMPFAAFVFTKRSMTKVECRCDD